MWGSWYSMFYKHELRAEKRSSIVARLAPFVIALPLLLVSTTLFANPGEPYRCIAYHSIGKLCCVTSNRGGFGKWNYSGGVGEVRCMLGEYHPDMGGYPKGSLVEYTWSADLWVGALVDGEPLVSVSFGADRVGDFQYEFKPDEEPFGRIIYRSISDQSSPEFEQAISEEDYIAVFTDTFTDGEYLGLDFFDQRPHKPLGIEVTQGSYGWSYPYAEDFILFNLTIRNIAEHNLHNVYVGIVIQPFVFFQHPVGIPDGPSQYDEICGYLSTHESWRDKGAIDTLNLAWHADNDGDPYEGQFLDEPRPYRSCTGIAGIRLLTPLPAGADFSYNWWVGDPYYTWDWGPRRRPPPGEALYDFHGGLFARPLGDRNKYYMLSNGEMDYDQARTATVSLNDPQWLPPPQDMAQDFADGKYPEYLLSVGPFYIPEGTTLPLAFAYVAGENFHTDPQNIGHLQDRQVDRYYENLDFSDIAKNAVWAGWVYDNPGVDTDGDGYFGESRISVVDSQLIGGEWVVTSADTNWYKGDGVPDWRAAGPPPAPRFWLTPTLNGIHVRFNGYLSETTEDIFSNIIDFEGYRVYFGRDDREASLSLVASYDRENFDKYVFDRGIGLSGEFRIQSVPFTLEQLRCLYGDADNPCDDLDFNPLRFTATRPYFMPGYPDSAFYFTKHDHNASVLGISSPITKIYPDQPKPVPGDSLNPDAVTEDGYLKYYEYECTIDGLLPTVSYYVNVTAFDFGSPESGLTALETSKVNGLQYTWPKGTSDQISGTLPPVYIYPNPYRIDAHYRGEGYEGRGREHLPDFRTREIHFENLPAKCWISIFTLDGDLVRKIRHDTEPSDPTSTHDSWNFITRNAQLPVTGIYYWTVEDDNGGVQMGKLVIIL